MKPSPGKYVHTQEANGNTSGGGRRVLHVTDISNPAIHGWKINANNKDLKTKSIR